MSFLNGIVQFTKNLFGEYTQCPECEHSSYDKVDFKKIVKEVVPYATDPRFGAVSWSTTYGCKCPMYKCQFDSRSNCFEQDA